MAATSCDPSGACSRAPSNSLAAIRNDADPVGNDTVVVGVAENKVSLTVRRVNDGFARAIADNVAAATDPRVAGAAQEDVFTSAA
ncbi:MAG: hypothetical protein M3315_16015 [Actinomycetota bacterium]|nr:hypothetical protein [Actinomycetota bacterium]